MDLAGLPGAMRRGCRSCWRTSRRSSGASRRRAVAASADVVATVGARVLGAAPERIAAAGRTHLRWHLGPGPARELLLGHHDTVWPVGSLATHPFAVTGDVLRPCCFGMKSGVALAQHAVAGLAAAGPGRPRA